MSELSGRVLLRVWDVEDAPALAREANDRGVWLNLRDAFPHPYSIEDGHRFIKMAREMVPSTFRAVVIDGELAGGAGYTLHSDVERPGAEVGYWIGRRFWGQGFGTVVVRAITSLAFEQHPWLQRVYAVPYSSNPASARVLEKVGYTLEGTLRQSVIKNGTLLDQWMYAILRQEWAAQQSGA
jgi:ribosomal-protein-alanine N-acetyltransferase